MVKIGVGARVRLNKREGGPAVGTLGTVVGKYDSNAKPKDRDVVWDGFNSGHDGDTGDGSRNHWITPKVHLDLVDTLSPSVETCEVACTPPWEPKVGDKIRWLGKVSYATMLTKGKVYEIVREDSGNFGITDDDQTSGRHTSNAKWLKNNFELVPPFAIEAGKFYRTRDARKALTGANRHNDNRAYPFFYEVDGAGWHAVTSDGKSCLDRDEDDLVAEWIDVPVVAAPVPKFKVGDVVDLYRDGKPVAVWSNMTITDYGNGLFDFETDVGLPCFEHELRLSPDPYAIGTKVTLTGVISGKITTGNNDNVNVVLDGVAGSRRSVGFPTSALTPIPATALSAA